MIKKEDFHIFSDFDGTITEETGNIYEQEYIQQLAHQLHIPLEDLLPGIKSAQSEILEHPEKYGWEIDGIIVAPATANRFLFANTITQIVLNELRSQPSHQRFLDTIQIKELLDTLFTKCYPLAETRFRDDAREFIETLSQTCRFAIVTSSRAEKTDKELRKLLGPDHGIPIVGDAKKHEVDPESRTINLSGLERLVYIDRPIYHRALLDLLGKSTSGLVIGDVAELDLLTPLNMGLTAILLTSDRTPPWEITYIENQSDGKTVPSLSEVVRQIESLI